MNYYERLKCTECLSSNKPFHVGADADHDPDPGITNGIFTSWTGSIVGISRDLLLWRRFAVSECCFIFSVTILLLQERRVH